LLDGLTKEWDLGFDHVADDVFIEPKVAMG
jgi:hypothetical protein